MDKLILKEFPIHIEISNNTTKANRVAKINSQSIYNGSLARFSRAIAIKNMHNWIKKQLKHIPKPELDYPVQIQIDIYTVINHGSISMRNGKTIWKYPSEDYVPSWDEDNLSYIWVKTIKDSLSELEFWPDDNVAYCIGTDSKVHFIDNLEDRRIEISFKKI